MICTLWTPFQAEREWKSSYREILLIPLYIFYSFSKFYKYVGWRNNEVVCKRNFNWLSIYRVECPIHNGTFKTIVWSSMKKISMSIILENEYFQFWFLYKSDLRISTAENPWRN